MLCLALQVRCTGDARLGLDRPLPGQPQTPPLAEPALDAAAADSSTREPSSSTPPADAGATAPSTPPRLLLELLVAGRSVSEASIQCPATCADVELHAEGGKPPYAFAWSDGNQQPARRLCPALSSALTVQVIDNAGQRAQSTLQVHVEPCPMSGPLCLTNPSLEGTAIFGIAWFSAAPWDAEAWDDCSTENPDINPAMPHVVGPVSSLSNARPFPAATDGATYFYLESNATQHQYVGQSLCAPLRANMSYHLQLDLMSAPTDASAAELQPAQLEIYASSSACTRNDKLWTSPVLGRKWQTHCVTFQPPRDANALVLNPLAPMGKAAVLVDHLLPVDQCP